MPDLQLLAPNRAADWVGDAVPGAKAYFYQAGTTIPVTVYRTDALTVPHPTPVVADGFGVFPPIWSNQPLRAVVTGPDDVTLPGYPLDPVPNMSTPTGAGTISFTPTARIPATTVQAAIERVDANIATGLAGVGLGNTENLPALAPDNIDGLAIPSGAYITMNATGGTFPAGQNGGSAMLVVNRRSTTHAVAYFHRPTDGRTWVRYQNTSWGAWREIGAVAETATWEAGTDTTPAMVSPAQLRAGARAAFPSAIFCHTVTAAGAGAQTFAADTWAARSLTTTIRNGITGASLASNAVTLPAGTYRFRAVSYQRGVDDNWCTVQLFNVTADAALANGAVFLEWGLNGFQEQTLVADIVTEATFAAETTVTLRHRNRYEVTDYTPAFDAVVARLEVERMA